MGYGGAERGGSGGFQDPGQRPLREIQEQSVEHFQPAMVIAPYRKPVRAHAREPVQVEVTDPVTNRTVVGFDAASHPAFMSAPVRSHWVVHR